MQTQSRLSVSGLQGSADEHEAAVVRELTRGHELTARLHEEAIRALRGQGQAESTAAFILGEMSRAFTLSICLMGGSGPAAPPAPGTPPPCVSVAARHGRAKDDGVPRKRKMTSSPHSDGYQWRKYGQKRIMRTNFPRCYYKCSNHRGLNCPATKQVQQQQHSDGDRPLFLVIYINEHTCHAPPADQPNAAARGAGAGATTPLVCFSRHGVGAARDVVALDHGAKEERERQALVSSLTCVLQQGRQHSSAGGAGASAASADASELPVRLVGEALDITDYDVITDTVYFGASSDGPRNDSMLF